MPIFGRSLALLVAGAALVAAAAALTRSGAAALGGLIGLLVSASSVLAAWYAERRGLPIRKALGLTVVGMFLRILFVTICLVLAVKVLRLPALPFVAGLGAVYVVGLGVEVWLLDRAARPQARAPP